MINEKLVDALAKILEGLNNNSSLDDVYKSLSVKNIFDQQTLGIAFSLIHDKILRNKRLKNSDKDPNSNRFRVLDNEEKEIIGMDNYNHILYLQNVGLLDLIDFEMILEQIILLPKNKITKEDINFIIMLSLVDFEVDILPGSRVLLFSSDKIN